LGIGEIVIDPTLAQVLGYSIGTAVVYSKNYVPDFSGEFTRGFRDSSFSVSAVESVSPGNGVVLTSRRKSGYAHYDFTGIRRYTFSLGGGYDVLGNLGSAILGGAAGDFSSGSARIGVTRVLREGFQATFFAEYRHYDLPGFATVQNAVHISVGLSWTPGERPLKIW
jgi:hypothetical protein